MNSIDPKGINNIIFDLGGVILDIDYQKTEQAFIALGISNFKELYNQFHASSFFLDLEVGKIDADIFVRELQNHAPGIEEEAIIRAWNAMLLNFPPGRIEFLLKLKQQYRTFLLSNTNAIHHQAFQKIELDNAGKLDMCFEKVYYSHEIGLRKPNKEIYEFVLRQNDLIASETLFIDDTPDNVEGAKRTNIHAVYLSAPQKVEDLLSKFLD